PDTDGYTFMKKVRVLPGLKEVPAIAVSGYASDEDRARALEAGYIALIPKPIDVDTLFILIQNLLRPAVSAKYPKNLAKERWESTCFRDASQCCEQRLAPG